MSAASSVPTAAKLVATAAESSTVTRANRVRLSRVLAGKSVGKLGVAPVRAGQPKASGAKPNNLKVVSDRYKMPAGEYAQLVALKKRLLVLGVSAKKSQLLRAGLLLLVASEDVALKKIVARVLVARTSRPATKAS